MTDKAYMNRRAKMEYRGVQIGHEDTPIVVVVFEEQQQGASYVWKYVSALSMRTGEELVVEREHIQTLESDISRKHPNITEEGEASAPIETNTSRAWAVERKLGVDSDGHYPKPLDFKKVTKAELQTVLRYRYQVRQTLIDEASKKSDLEALMLEVASVAMPVRTLEEKAADRGLTLADLQAQDEANAAANGD